MPKRAVIVDHETIPSDEIVLLYKKVKKREAKFYCLTSLLDFICDLLF